MADFFNGGGNSRSIVSEMKELLEFIKSFEENKKKDDEKKDEKKKEKKPKTFTLGELALIILFAVPIVGCLGNIFMLLSAKWYLTIVKGLVQ